MRALLIIGLVVLCLVQPAFAHPGHWPAAGFGHGFAHPLSGLDHVIAMSAIGLYAAHLGGRNLWLLPSAFVAAMIAGGALGRAGITLPMVEQVIGVSVVAMSLAVGFGVRVPTVFGAALIGAFALFHGYAHGREGAALASFLPYAAGFVVATVLLHVVGIGLGLGLNAIVPARALLIRRAAGAAGALVGAAMLAGLA